MPDETENPAAAEPSPSPESIAAEVQAEVAAAEPSPSPESIAAEVQAEVAAAVQDAKDHAHTEAQAQVAQATAATKSHGDALASIVEAQATNAQAALDLLKTSSNMFAPATIDYRVAKLLEAHVGSLKAATESYRAGAK
jgi:hypothetical protein